MRREIRKFSRGDAVSSYKTVGLLSEDAEVEHKSVSYWSPADLILGTTGGQLCLLSFGAIIIVTFGAVAWKYSTRNIEGDTYGHSWEESFWFSWGMFGDPGTQTGFAADDHPWVKLMAVSLSIIGFSYNLVFMGFIVELSRLQLSKLFLRGSHYVANGHMLVLGWTDQTPFMVEQLVHSSNSNQSPVLVLAEADKEHMQQQLDLAITGTRRGKWRAFLCSKRRRVDVWHGCPQEPDDLSRASAFSAAEIIIFGEQKKHDAADLEVVQTMMALASMENEPSGNIIACVKMPETVTVVDAILQRAEGIVARRAVHNIICLKALKPTVGDTLEMLASFIDGPRIICKPVKDCKKGRVGNAALTFGSVQNGMGKCSMCIGIRSAQGRITMVPDDSQEVLAEDSILVLQGSCEKSCRGSDIAMIPGEGAHDRRRGCTIIIVNWNENTVDLLTCFDQYLPHGSEVHILASTSLAERRSQLRNHIMRNTQIKHHIGPENEWETLESLPFDTAMCVLVCGPTASGHAQQKERRSDVGHAAHWSDAQILACTVTLGNHMHNRRNNVKRCQLLSECFSGRMKRVLEKDDQLKGLPPFIHSNMLEVGLVAMAADNRTVYNTLLSLMDPDPESIASIKTFPASTYLTTQGKANFEHVAGCMRKDGHILFGLKTNIYDDSQNSRQTDVDVRLVLNPEDQQSTMISKRDQLIAVTRDRNDN